MPPLQSPRLGPPPVRPRTRRPPPSATGLLFLLLCLVLSCGDDQIRQPDVVPPDPVTGLQVTDVTARSIMLSWQASGDDGTTGTAKRYDLRYATHPIIESTFPLATPVPNLPTPTRPGTTQAVLVYNLRSATDYHFALRVEDEVPNHSPLALLGPRATSADTIPPAPITDLVVASTTPTSFTLQWTAPGDDGTHGQVEGYEIRYATVPLDDVGWQGALPVPQEVAPLPSGQRQSVEISGLPSRRTLYLAVRARDAAENLSPLSNIRAARITGVPRTWYVRLDGTGDMTRIQTGIDSSAHGDTVLVAAGTYNEAIDFKGHNIVLKSQSGPEATVLDGAGLGTSIVVFSHRETNAAVLEGFTVTRGHGDPTRPGGGAIYSWHQSEPTIRGNTFRDNREETLFRSGGALWLWGGYDGEAEPRPVIENNVFIGNYAGGNGGAIVVGASAVIRSNRFESNAAKFDGGAIAGKPGSGHREMVISGNVFLENVAGDHGGAIEAASTSDLPGVNYLISHNLFVRNRSLGEDAPDQDLGTGGAIAIRNAGASITANTLAFNTGTGKNDCTGGGILLSQITKPVYIERNIVAFNTGCGVACYSFRVPQSDVIIVRNNLWWSNTPSDLAFRPGVCPPEVQEGNIFLDPLFCNPGADDFRLQFNTPARIGEEVMGALPIGGCGPPSRMRGFDLIGRLR